MFEIFSFEDYYNRNITRYFKAVGLEGDYYNLKDDVEFSSWLEYFAEGILDQLRRVKKPCQSNRHPSHEWSHTTNKYWIIFTNEAVLRSENMVLFLNVVWHRAS